MRLYFLSGLKERVGREVLEIDYSGRLSSLLQRLCDQYGEDLRRVLLDATDPGREGPFVKILVDGKDVGGEDLELGGGETLYLFLPIAGG